MPYFIRKTYSFPFIYFILFISFHMSEYIGQMEPKVQNGPDGCGYKNVLLKAFKEIKHLKYTGSLYCQLLKILQPS